MRGSYSSAVLAAATPREAKRLKLSYVPNSPKVTLPYLGACGLT
ncbi:Uncharacterised protein [Vibrio cholerae]|nr:Uncharacterised protein [Vibrio cholerae]CSI68474.1 Uncharacterised protein [Vibrio cholerae]